MATVLILELASPSVTAATVSTEVPAAEGSVERGFTVKRIASALDIFVLHKLLLVYVRVRACVFLIVLANRRISPQSRKLPFSV